MNIIWMLLLGLLIVTLVGSFIVYQHNQQTAQQKMKRLQATQAGLQKQAQLCQHTAQTYASEYYRMLAQLNHSLSLNQQLRMALTEPTRLSRHQGFRLEDFTMLQPDDQIRRYLLGMAENKFTLAANQYLWLWDQQERIKDKFDFTGIYCIHNVTEDRNYVGQSVSVLRRVHQHLTGHGNGDVYAALQKGDLLEIQTISLLTGGAYSLNTFEKQGIAAYDGLSQGYNKTKGNRA